MRPYYALPISKSKKLRELIDKLQRGGSGTKYLWVILLILILGYTVLVFIVAVMCTVLYRYVCADKIYQVL